MTNTIRDYLQCLKKNRSKRNRAAAVLVVLSVLVAAGVSWQLHLTGITMSGDAHCGCEKHKHDESCYEQKLVCTTPESDGHTHMDSCYEKVLVCGKEEHVHTLGCFSDSSADVETSETWEATLPALTDDRAENVVAIAQSQLSYHESEHNYKVENEETKKAIPATERGTAILMATGALCSLPSVSTTPGLTKIRSPMQRNIPHGLAS